MVTYRPTARGWRFAGAAVFALAGVVSAAAAADDRLASAGRWRIAAVVMDGKEVDPGFVAMLSVVYGADGTWTVFFKSIPVAEGTSSVDQANDPKTFEMRTSGPVGSHDQGWLYRGIYELEGDRRRICFASADRPRPRAFSSERRSGHILVTFERAVVAR